MPIPKQTITIRDPGLGLVDAAPSSPVFLGCSSAGSVASLVGFNSITDVVSTLGQGPLPEALAHCLAVSGGPVYGMRLTTQTAGAAGSVTKTAAGSSTGTITVAGNANDAYDVTIDIVTTGTVGVGRFTYSLDGRQSYSEQILIPAGGTYAVPNTGLTLTFTPGAGAVFFEAGDRHTFSATAPLFDASGLAAGITALYLSPIEWPFLVLCGSYASASTAATIAAALATHMTTAESQFRYVRSITDNGSGDTTTNATSSFASFSSTRVATVYGRARRASNKPFAGWGVPLLPGVDVVAARAAGSLISTSLARVATGALPGLAAISHDEFKNEVMDVTKATTLRTWPGRAGYYITESRLRAPAGSDFQLWQYGRVMDTACRTVFLTMQQFINAGIRTGVGGVIDERDAARIETRVNAALSGALLEPVNAEGTPGHVSTARYTVDRAYNVLSNRKIQGQVAIRPLAYPSEIVTTLGFTTGS